MTRPLSLGAFGAVGGFVALYAVLFWLGTPTAIAGAPGATGGVDDVHGMIIKLSSAVGVVIAAWAHLCFGRQLRKGPTSLNESPI